MTEESDVTVDYRKYKHPLTICDEKGEITEDMPACKYNKERKMRGNRCWHYRKNGTKHCDG